ncbi:hypothetical protein JXB41_07850 [Candidatus Woesearchaeota archaeon]|nr:hypothetical protein [Candidatus Woesearchaeota archaeon]
MILKNKPDKDMAITLIELIDIDHADFKSIMHFEKAVFHLKKCIETNRTRW